MKTVTRLAVAAALAVSSFAIIPAMADAQYGARGEIYVQQGHYGYGRYDDRVRGDRRYGYADDRYQYGYGYRGWRGPEGYFTLRVNLCPDLRRDRFGRRGYDWRDREVLVCPDRAWDYVPSVREARMGRTGDRLRPSVAYLDWRTGSYVAETRWGAVPVQLIGRPAWNYHRGRDSGVSFHFRLN